MRVYRLEIDRIPWLRELESFLGQLRKPTVFLNTPNTDAGDWRRDIAAGPPAFDRPQPYNFKRQLLQVPLKPTGLPADVQVSACNYFPVGGAGLGWHTDSGHPGWRIYIARPLTSVAGVFFHRGDEVRTITGGQVAAALLQDIKAIPDEPGIALAFLARAPVVLPHPGPGLSWHAVAAEGPRFSLGVRFSSGPTARALGLEWASNA